MNTNPVETQDDDVPVPVEAADDWSATRGLVKAVAWTLLAAVAAAGLMWPVCAYAPPILFHWAIRSALAFLTAWAFFGIAQRAASFVGFSVSCIAIICTLLVFFSHHVVVAVYGYPTLQGSLSGWAWCDPRAVLLLNIPTVVAIAFCTAIRHDGGGRVLLISGRQMCATASSSGGHRVCSPGRTPNVFERLLTCSLLEAVALTKERHRSLALAARLPASRGTDRRPLPTGHFPAGGWRLTASRLLPAR